MDILTGLAVLVFAVVVMLMYYKNSKETFTVVGKFIEPIAENKGVTFTQQPVDQTYTFADPIPDTATTFDRVLARFVDKMAPPGISKSSFPEPSPYTDSEVRNIARLILARVKGPDVPRLDFISIEYASKGVDDNKNLHYDISLIVYEKIKNFSLKLAIVCVVDPRSKVWIKKLSSFNGLAASDDERPSGVESVDELIPVDFTPDFVSFNKLYESSSLF